MLLLKIFSLTQDAHQKSAAVESCQLIQHYEQHQLSHDEHDDARPEKRIRLKYAS